MRFQTTMSRYPDIALECQKCYTICRLSDVIVRRSCPSCGLDIANWEELMTALQQPAQPSDASARP